MSYCAVCGVQQTSAGAFCESCGAALSGAQPMMASFAPPAVSMVPVQSKRTLAGLMGIFFGGFGVHKFVLGYTTEGILAIVITIFTCGIGAILGLIEGFIYLTKSDDEFIRTYQLSKKGWF